MRAAVIDIGSNSTKLTIGEDRGEEIVILDTLKNLVGIGRSTFYRGRISQEVFNQMIQVLQNFKKTIQQYGVDEVKVIATTAVREAENQDIFLDTIYRKTGFKIEVLKVGDVVYYIDSFLSYKIKKDYPIQEKNLLICELGAGSLDVSLMEKGYTLMNLGIPIGTLRLKQFKNRINFSQKETYEALEEHVENEIQSLRRVFPRITIDDIILIDESYSTIINKVLPKKSRETSFFKFPFRESKQLLAKVTAGNLDDFGHKHDIPSDLADSVDGYAIILNKLFQLIRTRSIYILETSLTEALLTNIIFGVKISKKYNKENQLTSVARFLCRKYNSDYKHTRHVANLAEKLFDVLKETLGLEPEDKLYLTLAAYLHNIGLFINNRAHHKHSEYMINSLNLFRLTDAENRMIACIARYHRRAVPQKNHYLYGSLSTPKRILVQKLSSILRIANALDSSHKQKVKKIEVQFDAKQEIDLIAYTNESFALETVSFENMKTLYEEVSGNKISIQTKRVV